MINTINTDSQAGYAMPAQTSAVWRARTACTTALFVSQGHVSAVATSVAGVIRPMGAVQMQRQAAVDGTFPGTSVWSPPT